jgi:hypothetical protein
MTRIIVGVFARHRRAFSASSSEHLGHDEEERRERLGRASAWLRPASATLPARARKMFHVKHS